MKSYCFAVKLAPNSLESGANFYPFEYYILLLTLAFPSFQTWKLLMLIQMLQPNIIF